MAKIQYNEIHSKPGIVIFESNWVVQLLDWFMSAELMTIYEYTSGLRKEAKPKNNCPKTELKAKSFSPPIVLSNGFIATCSIAIPDPIRNRETR